MWFRLPLKFRPMDCHASDEIGQSPVAGEYRGNLLEVLAMANKRRPFSASGKVVTLWRHLLDQVPVSDLCDELGLNPNVFYRWQKEFFEHGTAAFERRPGRRSAVSGGFFDSPGPLAFASNATGECVTHVGGLSRGPNASANSEDWGEPQPALAGQPRDSQGLVDVPESLISKPRLSNSH
jgi:hypothetical protein